MIMIIILPTTASQSGVWVPQTSRSFYYWQPVPRWRLLPLLANLGTPAMSPHTRKGNRYLSHWMNSGKREGRGGENCLGNKLPLLTTLQVHAQSTHKNTSNEEHMEFQWLLICQILLTTRECPVFNSIKLHLTAMIMIMIIMMILMTKY